MRVFEEDAATGSCRNTSNDRLRGIHLNQRVLVLTLCGHTNDLREKKYGKGERLEQSGPRRRRKVPEHRITRFLTHHPLTRDGARLAKSGVGSVCGYVGGTI